MRSFRAATDLDEFPNHASYGLFPLGKLHSSALGEGKVVGTFHVPSAECYGTWNVPTTSWRPRSSIVADASGLLRELVFQIPVLLSNKGIGYWPSQANRFWSAATDLVFAFLR